MQLPDIRRLAAAPTRPWGWPPPQPGLLSLPLWLAIEAEALAHQLALANPADLAAV